MAQMGLVAQSSRCPDFPFPQTHLTHGLRDGYAECGISVHDGNADLDLGDVAVEVPRHEALSQQLHAVHLCLGPASAVVSTPVSADRSSRVFRRSQGFVTWRALSAIGPRTMASAPAVVGFQGLAFLRGGIMA